MGAGRLVGPLSFKKKIGRGGEKILRGVWVHKDKDYSGKW